MDIKSIILTGVAVVIGGILNIAAAIWAEYQRRPKLMISIEHLIGPHRVVQLEC